METLEPIIHRAREGDTDAYGVLVRRFQDMAVGYAYSFLRDFQLAEDAAQEAFFEAYRLLSQLREPAAFPGWFRRIVFKHCDRLVRGKARTTVPLELAEESASREANQVEMMERQETKDQVLEAIDRLPDHERTTTALYYISGYSHKEVSGFLGVPVSTVKKRLHDARGRLRELLMDTVEESLRERRPSRDELFATRVIEILKAARAGDVRKVKELLEQDQRLLAARDPMGNTAMILAVNSGHEEVAELLLASGLQLGIHEAAAVGRTDRVGELLASHPELLESESPEGFAPLGLAAHFGHSETVEFLLARGADVNAISTHPLGVTPLHAALFGRKTEVARVLLARGADVNRKRGGPDWPRAGWTALHYAAGLGFVELIEPLLLHGADVASRDDEGKTPLEVAEEAGQSRIAEILRCHGAKG